MIRKILCRFGIHFYVGLKCIYERENEKGTFKTFISSKECVYCGKVKS